MLSQRAAETLIASRRFVWLLIITATGFAVFGLSRLKFDEEMRTVFSSAPAPLAQLRRFTAEFGSDDNDCVVVLQSDDLFSPAALAVVRDLHARAQAMDGVYSVFSLCDVRWTTNLLLHLVPPADAFPERYENVRQRAMEHPLVAGNLLSQDGRTTLMIVRLSGRSLPSIEVERRIARLRKVVHTTTVDSPVHGSVTGFPAIRAEIVAALKRDLVKMNAIAAGLALLLAGVIFRSPRAVVIAFLPPLASATWSLGAVGLVGERINVINAAMPTLAMVIGFSDSVHLVWHARELREAGRPRIETAITIIHDLWLPCALTALATAVGFGSLAVSQVETIRHFGITCACSCAIGYFAVITIAPLLVCTPLGDLGRRPGFDEQVASRMPWRSLARAMTRWPRLTAMASTAITILLVFPFNQLRPDYRTFNAMPAGSDSARALKHCDQEFGGALWAYVVVGFPEDVSLRSSELLAALADVHAAVDRQEFLRGPFSVLNLLRSLPGSGSDLTRRVSRLERLPADLSRRVYRGDLRRAVVAMRLQEVGTWQNARAFAALERELALIREVHPQLSFELTGSTVLLALSINQILADLRNSLALDAIVIFSALAFAFRSLRLGLASIVPNIFPLLAAGSCLVLIGRPLDYASAVVFSVCLGIAVDDTIHFITRFRKELLIDGQVRPAMERTYAAVGSVALTTTAIFLVGFGSLLFSDIPQRRTFSALSCVSLLFAIVGDFAMLPSLLVCLTPRPRPLPDGYRLDAEESPLTKATPQPERLAAAHDEVQ